MAKAENPILSRLKEAVPQPTVAFPVQPQEPEQPRRPKDPAPDKVPPIQPDRAIKLSVSLYGPDLKRLDEIKTYMQTRGHRNLSDSEALRLACRTVQIGERFLEEYGQMLKEDGRRKDRSSTKRK